MRLFALALVLLVGLPVPGKKQQQPSDDKNGATKNLPSPTVPVTVVVNQPPTKEQEDRPEPKMHDWFDVIIALGTVGALFVAARSLHYVKKQAISTQDAASAAADNASAVLNAERAWVMVDVSPVPGYHIFDAFSNNRTGKAFNGRIVCRNEGKTPAWIEEKRGRFLFADKLPAIPDLTNLEVIHNEREPIGAGKETSVDHPFEAVRGPDRMDEDGFLYGFIRYTDIFGRSRQTTFGYRLAGDTFKRLAGYPAYNSTT